MPPFAPTSAGTVHAEVRTASRRGWIAAGPWVAGALLAMAAALRLGEILPRVANRHAFGWDSARRAVLDVRAADALRGGHLLDYVGYVAGPETWPTLRLTVASIAHAISGPPNAFCVEHAVSILTMAGIAIAVAHAARALAFSAGGALLVTLLAATLLAGNGALLAHAANGMLEPLAAALTTASLAAWIEAREHRAPRPWALAILGNLLFHTKWQHGLLLAVAVLLLELLDPGAPRSLRRGLRAGADALARTGRTKLGGALLAAAVLLAATAAWVGAGGGFATRLGDLPISLRTVHGPMACGALAAFLFLEVAFWRARSSLRASVPDRLRFAWAWLATPMAAWLLVPFTWRLRTILVTSGTYDSGEAISGWWARAWFYLGAAWHTWLAPEVRPFFAVFLAATLVAAWRSGPLRRRLGPVAVLVAVEWAVLTFGTRHNYQARFALNLAPIVAAAACAWVTGLRSPWWRTGAALAALLAVAIPSAQAWRGDRLTAIVAQGFEPEESGAACRAVMERLPVERLPLLNEAPLSHRQGCALWATVLARQRGERPATDGWIVLTGATDPERDVRGYVRTATEARAGPLRAVVYEKLR